MIQRSRLGVPRTPESWGRCIYDTFRGGCCELQHLWVDPALRGRGVAGQLLDLAEAEAARRRCRQLVLFTHEANSGRVGDRYTRRGYELVARIEDYPIGDAALWYRKLLGSSDGRGAS